MSTITKQMAEAFLRWPLPKSVRADPCAVIQQEGRTGTNLLSYTEALQMMEQVVLPLIPPDLHALEMENTGLSIELEKAQAELAALREENVLLRGALELVTSVPKLTDAQLSELIQNTKVAIDAARKEAAP